MQKAKSARCLKVPLNRRIVEIADMAAVIAPADHTHLPVANLAERAKATVVAANASIISRTTKTADAGAKSGTTSLVVESAPKNLIVGSRKRGTSSNFQSRPRTSPTRATAVKSAAPASAAISVFFICVAIIPFCGDKRRPHCTLLPLLGTLPAIGSPCFLSKPAITNIVGYQKTDLANAGYNFIIPTFVAVGSSGQAQYNLNDIKLIGAAGDGMSEAIIGYTADATLDGNMYYWQTPAGSGTEEGWYDLTGTKVTTINLPVGTGLYLNCYDTSVQPQYAGQVYQGVITNYVPSVGYSMIGNATPATITLQDIKLVDAAGDGMSEAIIGYTADATLDGHMYYWQTPAGSGSEEGWYDETGAYVENYQLAPGQGVYLNCYDPNVKFTIKAVLE